MFETYFLPIIIFVVLGCLAGLLLSIVQKVFSVKTDERVEQVREVLPGANCGACGFAGCDEYAAAVVSDDVPLNKCIPGGEKTAADISAIMGKEAQSVEKTVAVVACSGCPEVTGEKYEYQGTQTCAACNALFSGKGQCQFSCIGFGDCVAACQFDALSLQNGIAVVDNSKCVGCMMCASACPKGLIREKRQSQQVVVKCSSHANGKATRSVCQKGCIGCKKCERVCPSAAVKVVDNLAVIDDSKCTGCGECVSNCPVGTIQMI